MALGMKEAVIAQLTAWQDQGIKVSRDYLLDALHGDTEAARALDALIGDGMLIVQADGTLRISPAYADTVTPAAVVPAAVPAAAEKPEPKIAGPGSKLSKSWKTADDE
jgi:hypothetical protein